MPRITALQAQAWAERTKLPITALDTDLEDEIANEVFAQLPLFDASTWVDEATTPRLIQVIIAKLYVAWCYDRQYSEDVDTTNSYAGALRANAALLIQGLNNGDVTLVGVLGTTAGFYPTDASSAQVPTFDDPSLGPAAFSMGMRF
jgi:hypothetical protein